MTFGKTWKFGGWSSKKQKAKTSIVEIINIGPKVSMLASSQVKLSFIRVSIVLNVYTSFDVSFICTFSLR